MVGAMDDRRHGSKIESYGYVRCLATVGKLADREA
jgi:hypothetical protein